MTLLVMAGRPCGERGAGAVDAGAERARDGVGGGRTGDGRGSDSVRDDRREGRDRPSRAPKGSTVN